LVKANQILRKIATALVFLALVLSAALLVNDLGPGVPLRLPRGEISGAPLLLVGVALLIVQRVIRPELKELLKNALLAATFLLWGIVQLMPQNGLSLKLGNLVIVLFVVDVAWTILLNVRLTQESKLPKVRHADLASEASAKGHQKK
jgi:peptidoglycan/LPS O-acetylase OafA/YrhL